MTALQADDELRIKGEVEIALYYPEYQRQIDETLFKGKSPQNNWLGFNGNEYGHQIHKNIIVNGKMMTAALLAYSITDGWDYGTNFNAAAHLSNFSDSISCFTSAPNKYLCRPDCIRISEAAAYYFSYWCRGDNNLNGRICDEGDDYVRWIFDIPANYVEALVGEAAGHHPDGCMNMNIDMLQLCQPSIKVAFHGDTIIDAGFSFIDLTDGGVHYNHPTSLQHVAFSVADGTDNQVSTQFYPNNCYLSGNRHTIYLDPDADILRSGVALYSALQEDLTNPLSIGIPFAAKALSPAILKTAAYKLAIIWKLTIS